MEGPKVCTRPADPTPPRSWWRQDGIALAILLIFAGSVHFWHLRHTEVPARDGIGFIRYAWQLDKQEWTKVLQENPHPPFYPLTILAMSYPVRYFYPGHPAETLQLSAQLISALAGVLLVIPMFFLGKILFHARVGFGAALLFQCLPVGSRILSDALTEGVFLFLAVSLLVLVFRAFQTNHFLYFGLIGLGGGLAYLTRPEGVLIVISTGLVLLVRQLLPARKIAWRPVLLCLLVLGATTLASALPYMTVIGQFTNKTTGIEILQTGWTDTHPDSQMQTGPLLLASTLATWGPDSKDFSFLVRHSWCLKSVGFEIIKGFHYVAWLPALLGLFWFRRRLSDAVGAWVLLLVLGLYLLLLWRVAYVVGYIAERHSLIFVACGLPFTLAALEAVSERLAQWLKMKSKQGGTRRFQNLILLQVTQAPTLLLIMVVGLAVSGLPKTLEPLHTNRAGFHAAGLWLAEHAGPGDKIMDPFCWAEFYAGQSFWTPSYLYDIHTPPQYIVLGGTENEHKRLPLIPWAKKYAEQAEVVYQWSPRKWKSKAEQVVVYHLPRADAPANHP